MPQEDKLPHEWSAIVILAGYFQSEVSPLAPSRAYKQKTADIIIQNVAWELKSPITKSSTTLETRFKEASRQSKYIVMDLRRIGMEQHLALKYIQRFTREHRRVRRVVCILDTGEVIEIK